MCDELRDPLIAVPRVFSSQLHHCIDKDPPINYCRVYPCLLVRQVDQFDRLKLPFIYSVWPLASLPGKSQSLLG